MKKLLGLVTFAPIAISACSSNDSSSSLDEFQTIAQEVIEASAGKGEITACDHYFEDTDIDWCKDNYNYWTENIEKGSYIDLELKEWRTIAENDEGITIVEVGVNPTFVNDGNIDIGDTTFVPHSYTFSIKVIESKLKITKFEIE